jgi:hypothetical protein
MIFGKSGNLLAGMIAKLKEGVSKAVEAIEKKIGDEYESMKNAADPIVQDVKSFGMEVFNDIVELIDKGRKITELMWEKISPVAKTIKKWWDDGWFGKIKDGLVFFVKCTGGVGGAIARSLPGMWKFVGYIINAIIFGIGSLFKGRKKTHLIIEDQYKDIFGPSGEANYKELVRTGKMTKEAAAGAERKRAELLKEFGACDAVTSQWDNDIRPAVEEANVNPMTLDRFIKNLFVANIFGTEIDYGETTTSLDFEIPGYPKSMKWKFRTLFQAILSNVEDKDDRCNMISDLITDVVKKRLDMVKLLSMRLNDVNDISTMSHLGSISDTTFVKHIKAKAEGKLNWNPKVSIPGMSANENVDMNFLRNIDTGYTVTVKKEEGFVARLKTWDAFFNGTDPDTFELGDVLDPSKYDFDIEKLKKDGLRVRADGKILIDEHNAMILSRAYDTDGIGESITNANIQKKLRKERKDIVSDIDKRNRLNIQAVSEVASPMSQTNTKDVPNVEITSLPQEEKREEPKVDVVQPPTALELYMTYKDMQTDIEDLIKEIEEENKKPENQTVSVEVANAAVKAVAEEAKKTVAEELPKIQYSADESVAVDPYLDDPDNADDVDKMKRALRNMAEDREKNGVSTPHRSAMNWNGTTIIPFNVLEANRHWEGGKFGAGTALETNRRGTVGIRIR